MKTTTASAALAMLFVSAATIPTAFAETTPSKPQELAAAPQAPPRRVEVRPARPAEFTEVRPGVWVHGAPNAPIYSGNIPIYPEAYDYLPAP
jgi:hypothetical protein